MKALKKIGIILAVLLPVLLIAFLMLVPPLTLIPQEEIIAPTHAVQTDFSGIADEAQKLIVQRGSYLVHTAGCADCHTPQGPQGPALDAYLSGGIMLANSTEGSIISANLTPDKETGLGNIPDAIVMRAIRSGVYHSGRRINFRAMPWAGFSNLSEEDLRAIVAYLRVVEPVKNRIPAPYATPPVEVPKDAEMFFPGNFGSKE